MFRNYIISAFRNISRNKFYTALNITGLSVGMAAFIFILLFIRDELTYDRHNEKYKRIYRIESNFNIANKHDMFAVVPVPMGPAFKLEFPEVETFVRFQNAGNAVIRYGDKEAYESNFYFTDSTVFDVFSHEFVLGSPDRALAEPFTVVLTQKIATKYFGDKNPIGEFIKTGSGRSYKITAVIKDQPGNTHLKYDALLSAATLEKLYGSEQFNSLEPAAFWNIGVYCYVLLNKNSDISTIHEKFPTFYAKYMKPIGDQINASFDLLTTPLAETHFRTGLSDDLPIGSNAYILIFSAVAVFILLLAVINYMNMATARSASRAREVGLRKVSGAYRSQLIRQFLGESLLLSVSALVIALLIVSILLGDFNALSGKSLTFSLLSQPFIFLSIIVITILVGFVSGSYPAFYLSSFQPVSVLKGSGSKSGKNTGLFRRVLVVIQFFIAIVMIIATIGVSDQLSYLRNKDLGFKKDNLVILELQDSTFRSKVESFRQELLQDPNILGSTNATGVPGDISWIQVMYVEREEKMAEMALILAQTDYDYLDVMGIQLVKGRNFDKKMGTDKLEAVLINETAAKELGWEDNPIGKKIQYGADLNRQGGRMLKVIGVFRDFNFRSLHNKVEPMIIFMSEEPRYYLAVRVKGDKANEALAYIEKKWNEFDAKRPFNYSYLTDRMDNMYQAEKKIGIIFRIATALTIFIALLGLLGLSSFVAERRTKEIGIRKILGASLNSILILLYREFLVLLVFAFILAVPVAWWRLDIWLNDSFVYHDVIRWTSFLLAGLLAFGIGLITISYHILRTASGNPVDAVKYE
jgi:putative ABC transport system permease protein